MSQKKYWRIIYTRAKEKSKKTNIVISILIFLGVSLGGFGIHWAVVGKEEALNELVAAVIYFFVGVILTRPILIACYVITEPAVLHEELVGFAEHPIIIHPEEYPEELGKFHYWRSLRVENLTPIDVSNCMLRLMDVINLETGESIIRADEDLTWSNREKESAGDLLKTIPGKLSKICDFARWDNDSKVASFTLAFGPTQILPIGEFRATIRISGKWQDQSFNYNSDILFSFDGQRIMFEGE